MSAALAPAGLQTADKETDMLRIAVSAIREDLRGRAGDLGTTFGAVASSSDIVQAFQAAINVIIAVEALEKAVADAKASMRAYLAERMAVTGCTSIDTGHLVASLSQPARSVVIVDPKLIPLEWWRTPEPSPDKVEMGKMMRQGVQIAGAQLSNGGSPILTIRAKK